jgi:3-hydroxy-9,10-secoandrosta-1,3,5(10)-triene-9,17-dione monooxygenase
LQSTAADATSLIERADALAGSLQERSEAAETLRRCPDETIADFVRTGLLRICQPRRYGGYELGWDVLCSVSQTLARGCGSQAWVQNIYTDHGQKVSTFPLAAQDEVWGDDYDARIAASFDPLGKARPTAGGAIFSGRHGFASGIDHAQWVIAGGHFYDGETKGRRCFFLLPIGDVTIIDDWHVVGFAGTGSKSFETREVFVPEHRIIDGAQSERGRAPGSDVHSAAIYRLPRGGVTATGFAAVIVGIAEGFIREYLEYTAPRKSRGTAISSLMGTQMGIGIATAEVHAASTIYIEAAREVMRLLERGDEVSQELRLRCKRDSAFAAQLSLAAVTRLFNAAGGRALSLKGEMQRKYRDLLAGASHHSIVWDWAAAEYGRCALGIDENES